MLKKRTVILVMIYKIVVAIISTSSDINVSIRLRDIPVSGVLSAGSGQNQSD